MKKVKAVGILLSLGLLSVSLLTGCGNSTKKTFKNYADCATLGAYTDIEYVPASREVTDEDVQSAIDSFCSDNATTDKITDRAVISGDSININYTETVSGSVVASEDSTEGYDMTIGQETLAPGLDSLLIEAMPTTTQIYTITYPDDYEDTTLAGLTADFEITINYITETTTPEYTDDLVNTASEGKYTNTTDYTAHLKEDLQSDKDKSAEDTDKQSVLKTIKENSKFTKYPQDEVQSYTKNIIDNITQTASNYGIDFETYLQYFYGYTDKASFVSYLKETVQSVMQEKIIVCSIALKEDLIATKKEVDAYKKDIMKQYSIKADEVADYYSEDDLIFYATEEKVLDFVLEHAVQVDEIATDTDAKTE